MEIVNFKEQSQEDCLEKKDLQVLVTVHSAMKDLREVSDTCLQKWFENFTLPALNSEEILLYFVAISTRQFQNMITALHI